MQVRWLIGGALLIVGLLISCGQSATVANKNQTRPVVITTLGLMASLASELVGDSGQVESLVPSGQDPHDWEPSAKDLEKFQTAGLIVESGLGLEAGLERALSQARERGTKIFTALDYVVIRRVGPGQGIPSGDPDQTLGAKDPHFWLDPLAVKAVVLALSGSLQANLGLDCSVRTRAISNRLDALDASIRKLVQTLPEGRRRLVTGHESLGYFADRYGFKLIGAIIPSMNSQAEVSASHLVALKQLVVANQVGVVFTELGTSPKVAAVLSAETGAKLVALNTHSLGTSASYFDFLQELANTIVSGLKQ